VLLKQERKRQKKRQTDFPDISKSTISRIEKGDPTVQRETLEHYARQLDQDLNQLEKMVSIEETLEPIKSQLESIELDIELRHDLSGCYERLNEIDLINQHPYWQVVYYLQAKALFYMGKYNQSEKKALLAIESAHKSKQYKNMNIASFAHSVLSNIYYRWYSAAPALKEIEKALFHFDRDGDRSDAYFMMLQNKAFYLEQVQRYSESERVIEQLYSEINQIEHFEVRAATYDMAAKIKQRSKLYDEALEIVKDGLRFAGKNNQVDRVFLLLIRRGKIYEELGQLLEAEREFKHALKYEKDLRQKGLCMEAYNRLGKLYFQQERLADAREMFMKTLSTGEEGDPRYVQGLIGLSDLSLQQKNQLEAAKHLKKALLLSPKQNLKQRLKIIVGLTECFKGVDDRQYSLYMEQMQNILVQIGGEIFD
jgi:tetratricopeptide (TPR) repeat protein